MNALMIGNGSLLIQCAQIWLDRRQEISGIISENAEIREWAARKEIPVFADYSQVDIVSVDWLFSVANLKMLPASFLKIAKIGALNFHDGPLPCYAGLNAPVWALLNHEKRHGITWHLMQDRADTGDIVEQRIFEIPAGETALSLNAKCYAAGIDGFTALVDPLIAGNLAPESQDTQNRHYFGRNARPKAAGVLDFTTSAQDVVRFVNALDHGNYANPLAVAKIIIEDQVFLVGNASAIDDQTGNAGTVLKTGVNELTIACHNGAVALSDIKSVYRHALDVSKLVQSGDKLTQVSRDEIDRLLAPLAKAEADLVQELSKIENTDQSFVRDRNLPENWQSSHIVLKGDADKRLALINIFARCHGQSHVALAVETEFQNPLICSWMPLATPKAETTIKMALEATKTCHGETIKRGAFVADLFARTPNLRETKTPIFGITHMSAGICGTAISFEINENCTVLHFDENQIDRASVDIYAARLLELQNTDASINIVDIPRLNPIELDLVLNQWNDTKKAYDNCPIHKQFETIAAKSPDETALVFEEQQLSFQTLNNRANTVALTLEKMGVKLGDRVGIHLKRSPEMIIALLATLKVGAAYVPLDPNYPSDRIAHYVNDSGAKIIITQTDLMSELPSHDAQTVDIKTISLDTAANNPNTAVTKDDLAYLIYTSGSTGTPKGVMVEHGNVANFMSAMDDRVSYENGDSWLAVTSLSFDISVLELLFTLTRGIKLILSSDDSRLLISNGKPKTSAMDFSLYYWGNDDETSANKYDLLLKGAQFADQNGFVAVWTPERHFHAFGGPYPNPAVTGAAVAAVTNNIAVRAGSCVAPLHHPARIAEEWAVIDNLTNGRVGLAMASGWQPDDFVLRPENTPPDNKPALFETIKTVRRLWEGEAVEFPTAKGTPHAVVTQPRPLSKTLPIWVTSAGNPETWVEAANLGANVLTHLLGQSVAEVGEKIEIYHNALRAAGHDPKDFKVTVMLHTLIGEDREVVREIAREPMKDYLRSAAGLIKQYAYAFPAFKKTKGAETTFDLGSLEPDELEAILDFAFTRYFEDSGLFGTPDDAARRVAELQAIGVGEVACLIDYGIDTNQVLEGLRPLAAVVAETNATTEMAPDDFSIAAQIERHNISHLQCTPSMARMMLADQSARQAFGGLKHVLLGGEALPDDLVQDVKTVTNASLSNMYGPTETTIWSTSENVQSGSEAIVNIGTPIANTQVYVLDGAKNPVAVGEEGELYIAGDGVTRGYWQRPELTNERYVPNPFTNGRMYQTGDLVKWRSDGKLDYVGRADQQLKLRGYRIELGEIDAAISKLKNVDQAVVVAREDRPGDVRLVAYLMAASPIKTLDLRQHLLGVLPDYMVPSHFVQVDHFPLTPNKKIDRKALPAPKVAQPTSDQAKPLPKLNHPQNNASKTDLLREIGAIWMDILGVTSVNPQDNFFDLGGHSLLAVQTHRAIRDQLNLANLSITDIFRFPTLDGLCAQLATPDDDTKPITSAPKTTRNDTMSRRRAMRAARLQKIKN